MFKPLLSLAIVLLISPSARADEASYVCLPATIAEGPRLECSDETARRTYRSITGLLDAGRIDEGLQLLELLVAAKPFQSDFRQDLVERKLQFKRYDGIEAHSEMLLKLNSRNDDYLLLNARVMAARGDAVGAIEHLSKHVEKPIIGLRYRKLRAQIHEQRNEWKEARDDWQFIENSRLPSEEKLHRYAANLREQQFEIVRKDLAPLQQKFPATFPPQLADLLAQANQGLRRNGEAEQLYKGILERHPHDHDVRVRLVKCLIDQRKYEEAVLNASWVLSEDPYQLPALYQLARARILQEKLDLAGQALARLSQLDRGNEWTVRAQAAIWSQLEENRLSTATLSARNLEANQASAAPEAVPTSEPVAETAEVESEPESPAVAEAPTNETSPEENRETASVEEPCLQHAVARGDTLETISLKYLGTRQAWNTIIAVNAALVTDPHRIREGMVLWIPRNREATECAQ